MDYAHFEVDIINPYVRDARARANLLVGTNLPLSFAPARKSFSELRDFLIDTDYNCSPCIICTSSYNFEPTKSAIIPIDCSFRLGGYVSPKHPDCFVWEGGIFEEGLTVFFGNGMRAGKVLGVCGVGKNYFMMGIKDLGTVLEGEVLIRRMVVSFPPTDFSVPVFYRIQARFLKPFLKSMIDFIDETRVDNSFGVKYISKDILEDSLGNSCSELFDGVFASTSEIGIIQDFGYSADAE
jgi:hypothetical protein